MLLAFDYLLGLKRKAGVHWRLVQPVRSAARSLARTRKPMSRDNAHLMPLGSPRCWATSRDLALMFLLASYACVPGGRLPHFNDCRSREFKLAMRKADAPGVRLATYRSSSMPHLNVNSKYLQVRRGDERRREERKGEDGIDYN